MYCTFTCDSKPSGTFCSAQRIFCNDGVVSAVLGADFKYLHRADPTSVCDVIVSVGIKADVISVPGNMGCGVSCYCTAHVALIALWTIAHFEWNSEGGGHLKAALLGFREVYRK